MSWSVTIPPVPKEDFNRMVDNVVEDEYLRNGKDLQTQAARCQLQTAKIVAKRIAESLPGPYLQGFLSGHANAAGWHEFEGYAPEAINVNVSQVTKLPNT